jgi:anti-sigma-K factor RskA
MDSRGNDPLREMLAAEYALGTLRGGARRRFERWLRQDAELRAITAAWSEHLVRMTDAIAPVAPSARVWDAIEMRLPGFASRPASAPSTWWNRVGLWRGIATAFAIVAVVSIGMALRPAPTEVRFVTVQALPGAIATIVDPTSGKTVGVFMAAQPGREAIVQIADGVAVGPGQVLQLWSSPNGTDMVSMGVLPVVQPGRTVHLSKVDAAQIERAKAIGLSLEPVGGSPQPTHVLGLGALVRVAG